MTGSQYRGLPMWGVAIALLFLVGIGTGCNLEEFDEEFDTEFTVPKPAQGFGASPYQKSKRFKMENDPQDAEDVRFLDASMAVIAPAGYDLTFMTQLDVYVCDSIEFEDCADVDSGNLTLLASASEFQPDETSRNLDILYDGDIRGFSKDKRVVLTWIVYPTGWGYAWPEEGVTIQTNVHLRIKIDLL